MTADSGEKTAPAGRWKPGRRGGLTSRCQHAGQVVRRRGAMAASREAAAMRMRVVASRHAAEVRQRALAEPVSLLEVRIARHDEFADARRGIFLDPVRYAVVTADHGRSRAATDQGDRRTALACLPRSMCNRAARYCGTVMSPGCPNIPIMSIDKLRFTPKGGHTAEGWPGPPKGGQDHSAAPARACHLAAGLGAVVRRLPVPVVYLCAPAAAARPHPLSVCASGFWPMT
jgi:hypothetical protein